MTGLPDLAGGERRERGVMPDHRLGTEAAADELRDDPDVRRREAEQRGDRHLGRGDPLGGVVQDQPAVVPGRGGGRASRWGCGGWPRTGTSHRLVPPPRRGPPPRHPVTIRPGIRPPKMRSGTYARSRRLLDHRSGWRLLVLDPQQRRGVLGPLERVGDDQRDRLAGVMHLVVLHGEEGLARCRAAEQRGKQCRHRRPWGGSRG